MVNGRKLIMGLGSGRCGTNSLAVILDAQFKTNVSHERYFRLTWLPNYYYLNLTLDLIMRNHCGEFVGDVSYYYLPYVDHILDMYPDTKFVCIRRDAEDTIKSQIRSGISLHSNHFTSSNSKYYDHKKWNTDNTESRMYRPSFPQYDLPQEDALRKYVHDYYDKSEYFERVYPNNFKIFGMDSVLNTEKGQLEMFQFCELKSEFVLTGVQVYKEFTGDPNQFKGE